jgi:serine/threonine protein kinase
MILAGELASAADVQRFRAEAQAAANLQHPNIVAIHEIGQREGQHFFAMEYVDGRDLGKVSAQCATRDAQWLPRAAAYVQSVAHAIDYAHAQGILHRDLKPSNILIDATDQPRVTDFGLAKRIKTDSDLTLSGQILGTPNFMSPEQAAGRRRDVGPQSDIYSLGAILYFLLTGRAPFQGLTTHETINKVLHTEPDPPRRLNPSVPRDLEVVCLKCLEKEPSRRYASARAMADDLGRFLHGEPVEARAITATEKLWRVANRHRLVTSLSLSLVALAGTVAVLVARSSRLPGTSANTSGLISIAPMPTNCAQGVSGIIDGKIYVTSATDGNPGLRKSLYSYDPKLNAWQRLADCNKTHANPAGGVLGGKLYVAGGSDELEVTDSLEAFVPTTGRWIPRKAMPTARRNCAGAVLDDRFYVLGGNGLTNQFLRTVESYDPATDSWRKEPDMLTPRGGFGAVVSHGTIYVIGGATNTQGQCSGSVEIWRPGANWSLLPLAFLAAMPVSVAYAFNAELDGHIYVFGGTAPEGPSDRSMLLTRGDGGWFWLLKQHMPKVRFQGSGAQAVDGRLWLFGGWSVQPDDPIPNKDVFVFDPSHNSWSTSEPQSRAGVSPAPP